MNRESSISISISIAMLMASTFVQALDLGYGRGDFGMSVAVNSLFSSDVDLDINTWSLSERHKTLNNSKLYYHFKLDYFSSDTLDRLTDFASTPLTTSIPFLGSGFDQVVDQYTRIPVPSDYRIHGVNFDIGLGYDWVHESNRLLGVAINTGISTPFMKISNMRNTANLLMNVLDTFDTHVKTYKLGAGVYGEYQINNLLILSANGSINYQTGEMDNDLVGSGISVDGSYSTLDLNLKYKPKKAKNLYVTAGYSYNKWEYDSTTVSTPVGSIKVPQVMDVGFDSSNLYLGVGYVF